jgi:hypothetical protein
MQWDLNTGDMVQQYDYHLAAVNTVTFIDQNRRFVSTSGMCGGRRWGALVRGLLRSVLQLPLPPALLPHCGWCRRHCACCPLSARSTMCVRLHDQNVSAPSYAFARLPPAALPLPLPLPADDKTIRMWEYGIQAQAKYIAGGRGGAGWLTGAATGPQEGRQALSQ